MSELRRRMMAAMANAKQVWYGLNSNPTTAMNDKKINFNVGFIPSAVFIGICCDDTVNASDNSIYWGQTSSSYSNFISIFYKSDGSCYGSMTSRGSNSTNRMTMAFTNNKHFYYFSDSFTITLGTTTSVNWTMATMTAGFGRVKNTSNTYEVKYYCLAIQE